MKIEYLGHACFRLDDVLVVDPYKDGSVQGLEPLRVTADGSWNKWDAFAVRCVVK